MVTLYQMKQNSMINESELFLVLKEIRDLLKTQNELLENQQQSQTKITVVGNKVQTNVPKGLKSNENFTL